MYGYHRSYGGKIFSERSGVVQSRILSVRDRIFQLVWDGGFKLKRFFIIRLGEYKKGIFRKSNNNLVKIINRLTFLKKYDIIFGNNRNILSTY